MPGTDIWIAFSAVLLGKYGSQSGEKKVLNVTFTYIIENLYWQTKQENQYLQWKVCLLHKYFHKNVWIILRSWKFVSQFSWKVHIKMVS